MEAGRKQLVSGEKIAGGRVSAEEALDTMVAKSAAIAVIAGAAGVCHHANPARYGLSMTDRDGEKDSGQLVSHHNNWLVGP